MKKFEKVMAAAAMIFLIIALLLTSFQVAIYGDSEYRFYEREYEKYGVTEALGMEMSDVMDVTDKMMAYLIGQREELSVITTVEGKEQDFFNEQDRFHMGEVRDLFIGGLNIRLGACVIAVLCLAFLIAVRADIRRILSRSYVAALGITAAVAAVIGLAAVIDFNAVFVQFHHIFFDNDQWIFDPASDYMIRMLPEGLFYDFVMRIGGIFLGILLILLILSLLFGGFRKGKNTGKIK